jgi:bacillithiol biosynthesis deacetylase BshB1
MSIQANMPPTADPLDILAIAAHRDDVEQTCGGTLLAHAARGWRTGILDLTRGELGTRGTAAEREAEANAAARILRVTHREALDLPDGNVENTQANRLKLAAAIRRLRPRVVILPYWQGRHPDHYRSATLGYEACFVAGLKKAEFPPELAANHLAPHRPYKIVYASLYADVRPTFVVDITPHIETRLEALLAYRSQYGQQPTGANLFVPEDDIRERMFATARHFGLLAGVKYAEPFIQKEVERVEDLMLLGSPSI